MVVYVILSLYVKFQVSDRHNSIPIHPPLEKNTSAGGTSAFKVVTRYHETGP